MARFWPPRPWWTPRYVVDRLSLAVHERRFPDAPWLTRQSVEILDSLIRPTDTALEWGSGRSTLWLARRVGHLTSMEENPDWHQRVLAQIQQQRLPNVTYLCAADLETYTGVVDRFPEGTLDLALVDGLYRSACAVVAVPHIRPGGMVVVDNANRFLPSRSRSPFSRRPADGPRLSAPWAPWESLPGLGWADFAAAVADWRCIWTTDGVTDTAIWLKP